MPNPLQTPFGKPEVVGLVEQISPFVIRGWAFDRSRPQVAVDLTLWVDGICVTWFRPQQLWPLLAQQLGWPEHALGPVRFQLTMPVGIADGAAHHIEVRCAHTDKLLPVEDLTEVQWQDPNLRLGELPYAWWPVKELASPIAAAPQVSVVVLNRNGAEVLADLLQSWHRHNQSVSVEWIVIDHASTDHSLELLNDWQSRLSLRTVALQQNQSFSASCNLGARMARAPLLLFLNNDLVWQHDALPALLESLQNPAVGAVGMKLLKVLPRDGNHQPWTEVQHLGVRFVPHVDGYWPQETTPLQHPSEQEWGPQEVPCVTGAVLLCRAVDFWAVGGFDEQYFYGFEDVALCLAIRFKLGKRIMSRNDAWALHRHGHTRLTGREAAVTQRLAHNAHVLEQQWGLWLKWHWWQDLWQGTRQLGCEALSIGIQMPQLPPPYGLADAVAPVLKSLAALTRRIRQTWPHAQLTLVQQHTAAGYWVKGLHVLVVTDPALQRNELQQARADLRMVAWMHDHLPSWTASNSWWDWDLRLVASKKIWHTMPPATRSLCHQGWAAHPVLGPWQSADGLKQVRAVIRWPTGSKRWLSTVNRQVQQLHQAWAAAGITCRQQGPWPLSLPPDQPSSAEVQADVASAPSVHGHWVAEICVWLLPVPNSQDTYIGPVLQPGHLNVLWWQGSMSATGWPEPAALVPNVVKPVWQTDLMPDSTTVLQALEIQLGRPFSAP